MLSPFPSEFPLSGIPHLNIARIRSERQLLHINQELCEIPVGPLISRREVGITGRPDARRPIRRVRSGVVSRPKAMHSPIALAKNHFVFFPTGFFNRMDIPRADRKPSDPLQNRCEQLSRHGDLRQLERHVLGCQVTFRVISRNSKPPKARAAHSARILLPHRANWCRCSGRGATMWRRRSLRSGCAAWPGPADLEAVADLVVNDNAKSDRAVGRKSVTEDVPRRLASNVQRHGIVPLQGRASDRQPAGGQTVDPHHLLCPLAIQRVEQVHLQGEVLRVFQPEVLGEHCISDVQPSRVP